MARQWLEIRIERSTGDIHGVALGMTGAKLPHVDRRLDRKTSSGLTGGGKAVREAE
jgi:hypothetical protein